MFMSLSPSTTEPSGQSIDRKVIEQHRSNSNKISNIDINDDSLKHQIEAAGRIYETIKVLRLQQEQHHKKRLLRRKVRILEHQNSWRKSQLMSQRQQQPQSLPIVDSMTPTASNTSVETSSCFSQTVQAVVEPKSKGLSQDQNSQLVDRKLPILEDNDEKNVSVISEGRTVDDDDESNRKQTQQNQQQHETEEELLQLCEEQQDLLERLACHHQQERHAWEQKQDQLKQELHRVEEVHTRRAIGVESSETKHQLEEEPSRYNATFTENIQLKQQLHTLRALLVSQEQIYRQQIKVEQTKTQIASNGMEAAMKRIEALQELAMQMHESIVQIQQQEKTVATIET